QAEDGIRDWSVTGVQTCALPIWCSNSAAVGASARSQQPPHEPGGNLARKCARSRHSISIPTMRRKASCITAVVRKEAVERRPKMSDEITVHQCITGLVAELRGRALGKWQTGDGFAVASCIQCGRELTVYRSAMEPEIDGEALASGYPAAVRASAA